MSGCCDPFVPSPDGAGGGGGGGGSGVNFENETVPVAGGPFTTINLDTPDLVATDAGGGVVNISFAGTTQRFAYTVTGLEPDLSDLVIPLPAARADALYQVQATQATAAFQLSMNIAAASRTNAQFVLSLSGPATAGDIFWFTVDDPT